MSADPVSELIPALVFLAWMASIGYSLVTQRRLFRYLEEHHHDRWCYLTSGPFWGPGGANGFRGLPYILGDQDNDDPKIVVLKAAVKRSLLCAISVFGAMVLMALTVAVIVVFFRK